MLPATHDEPFYLLLLYRHTALFPRCGYHKIAHMAAGVPNELLACVFSFLRGHEELHVAGLVCERWRNIIRTCLRCRTLEEIVERDHSGCASRRLARDVSCDGRVLLARAIRHRRWRILNAWLDMHGGKDARLISDIVRNSRGIDVMQWYYDRVGVQRGYIDILPLRLIAQHGDVAQLDYILEAHCWSYFADADVLNDACVYDQPALLTHLVCEYGMYIETSHVIIAASSGHVATLDRMKQLFLEDHRISPYHSIGQFYWAVFQHRPGKQSLLKRDLIEKWLNANSPGTMWRLLDDKGI
jgi:hypothetical protein